MKNGIVTVTQENWKKMEKNWLMQERSQQV